LVSKGYFNHDVSHEVSIEDGKASVIYNVEVDTRYYIKEVLLPTENSEVAKIIREEWNGGGQKNFKAFDEDVLKLEKTRLTSIMRNKGYFDFREEYINFRVDSFSNYKLLNLHVDVDSLSGTEPHKKYYIDEIYIVPDFNVEGSRGINGDTILVSDGRAGGDRVERDYHYISTVNKFRPRSLTRLIKLTKGEPYSEKEYRNTINQFLELGVFRFVNIRFEKEADSKLKAYILLTPADRWAASLELEGHTKNGDSYENANLGTALKGALKNKNFFGGGELMNFNLAGALEFNFDRNPNT